MACERYEDWVIESALGALGADNDAELKAHAALCAPCQDELHRMHQLLNAIDAGVAASVNVDASPFLAVQLRQRLLASAAPANTPFTAWFPATVGVSVAGALLVAILWWPQAQRVADIDTSSQSHDSASTSPVAQSAPKRVPTAVSVGPPHVAVPTTEPPSVQTKAPPEARPGATLEVIVPPGQSQALAMFVAAIRDGRVQGAALQASLEQGLKPLSLEPIELSALEVAKLREPEPLSN